MTKRNKFYQIGFIVSTIVCIGLMLAMGIIAIQKQMKLNMSFQMNPSIVCKIYAGIGSDSNLGSDETLIFSNVDGALSIHTNWTINANTLSYDNAISDVMGQTIYLKVVNYTNCRVLIEPKISDTVQTSKVTVMEASNSGTTDETTFSVGVPGSSVTGFQLNFTQAFTVDVSGVDINSVTISAGQNVYTINGTYYVKSTATSAQFTLTVASTSWTMGTVTYTVGGGSAQTLTGTTTDNLTYTYTIPGDKITGAIVINATAISSYSIYATINGEDVLIGDYFPKSESQVEDITYPSTFTGTGDLMSAVTGVSEVTATQITIAANTTGPITIVPKGYWIGTYTSTYPSETVYDYDAKANIPVGTVWAGYKFLQFNGATDYGSYPMRWIIIGGDNANDTSIYGIGANKEYDTFSAKQVLLLSEKTLVSKQFHGSSAAWTGSTLQTWLNTQDTSGNFLPDSKMQSYYNNIATVTLQTAWSPNSDSSSTVLVELADQKIFLLASKHGYNKQATNLKDTSDNYTYQNQNYMVEEYLGDETTYPDLGYEHNNSTTCLKMFAFSGSNTSQNSYWWLRSGRCTHTNRAYCVNYYGYVDGYTVYSSYGVRPSFVFNLA